MTAPRDFDSAAARRQKAKRMLARKKKPTLQELAKELGLASRGAARRVVLALEKKE